jgi:hypothetical protein
LEAPAETRYLVAPERRLTPWRKRLKALRSRRDAPIG